VITIRECIWQPPFDAPSNRHPILRLVYDNSVLKEGDHFYAKRLVACADILFESFISGAMEKWGLGYENFNKDN